MFSSIESSFSTGFVTLSGDDLSGDNCLCSSHVCMAIKLFFSSFLTHCQSTFSVDNVNVTEILFFVINADIISVSFRISILSESGAIATNSDEICLTSTSFSDFLVFTIISSQSFFTNISPFSSFAIGRSNV